MLKKICFFIICLLLLISANIYAIENGLIFKEGNVVNSQGESLVYYLSVRDENKLSNNLFIGVQGSQGGSNKRFEFWTRFVPGNTDILLLEKYAFDNEQLYNKTNCRQRRIQDIEFVVNHIIKNVYNNGLENIILFGGSEGGAIVPEIANDVEEVTHMIVMGAGGYSQAKEFEILLEKEINSKEKGLFYYVNINNKEELFAKFDEIRNNPSENEFWLGNTYKHLASFLDYSPEKYIEKLDIPVLYVIGKADKSVPYETVKYLSDKLKGRDNFSFRIIPEINHKFTEKDGNSKMNYIIEQVILPWCQENGIEFIK